MPAPPFRPEGKGQTVPPLWRSLNVRPWSLVRLKNHINNALTAGTIVALSNEAQVAQSTPVKGGHPLAAQGFSDLNSSAQVKIYVWHKEVTVDYKLSAGGGRKGGSIQEPHVLHAATSTVAPSGGWSLQTPVVVKANDGTSYVTAIEGQGGKLRIPNGTVGEVVQCMTPTARIRTKDQQVKSVRSDWYYVVRMGVQKTEWKWVKFEHWVSVAALEPLDPRDPVAVQHHNLIMSTAGPPQFAVVSHPSI